MRADLSFVLVILLLFVCFVNSQQEATIRTTTILGFDAYSEGIPALQVSLFQVSSILVTPDDDLLLAELGSSKIRFYNKTSSTITTVAGKANGHPSGFRFYNLVGPLYDVGADALLLGPESIIYGPSGEVIVCNRDHYNIRNISFSANTVTTIAGITGRGAFDPLIDNVLGTSSYLRSPYSVVLSYDKQFIYILENLGNTIRKLELSTMNITTLYGDKGSVLQYPACMALDPSGSSLYVCDTGHSKLLKLDLNGNTFTSISAIVGTGFYGYSVDGTPGVAAKIESINGIAVTSSKIYFSTGHRVAYYTFSDQKVYTLVGGVSAEKTIAGYKDNDIGTNCLLNNPGALALSRDETVLYISDLGNGRVRKLDLTTSILKTIVGYGGEFAYGNDDASPIPLFYDNVLLAASPNNFFYADGRTFKIRQINNTGTVKTIYEVNSLSGTGIGEMAVHPSGELYFTDRIGCYIKKVVGSNAITVAGNGTCLSDSGIPALTGAVRRPFLITFVPNDPDTWYFLENEVFKIKRYSSGYIYDYAGGGALTSEGILASASSISPSCLSYYNGGLYFCETSRIRRIDLATNQVFTVVGLNMIDNTNGAVALNAKISPTSIAFTPNGELFFTDSDNNLKYVYNGIVYFFKSEHTFKKPQQIRITQNIMYLFDSFNTRIEKIDLTCPKGSILGANLTCNSCSGNYTNNEDFSKCIMYCFGKADTDSSVCKGRGACIEKDICQCNSGYTGPQCDYPICYGKTSIDSAVCSGVGNCISHNNCSCLNGYNGGTCEIFTCFGKAFNSSNVCSSNGKCVELNSCSCNATWLANDCSVTTCYGILSNSSQVCSGKGPCVSFNNCQCNSGYVGKQCEQAVCFGKNASDPTVCSGFGKCSSPNTCVCNNGYVGSQCESYGCFGKLFNSSSVCSSQGRCEAPNTCVCNSTWLPNDCSVTTCFGILSNSSSQVCSGKGSCLSYNNCQCINGYTGSQCEQAICYGKNSSDPTVCSGLGSCLAPNNCSCAAGYVGSKCDSFGCFGKIYNSSSVCSANGACIGPNTCTCNSTWLANDCSVTSCYGILSNSSLVCSGKGSCVSFNNCQCNSGYISNQCEQAVCYGKNSSDLTVCSGLGSCLAPNSCSCSSGYVGSQCESYTCFGKLFNSSSVCSSKGKCIKPNTCVCDSSDWISNDCSVTSCYGKLSNSSLVCSGKGYCSSVNNCSCNSGFYGNECEKAAQTFSTPSQLNSKNVSLPSGFIAQFPKSFSSIINLSEAVSVVSYVSNPTSDSIGSIIEIQITSQSKSTVEVNNLPEPIVINFPQLSIVKPDNKIFACLYFDTQKNIWTNTSVSTSVTIISIQNSVTNFIASCYTTHLTQFGVFLVDQPVTNTPTTIASSNSSKKQSNSSALGVILGVVLSLVAIITIVIIVIVIVVVFMIRKKRSQQSKPNNPHIEVVPIEENTLVSATSQNEIAKNEVSLNDIEMNEVKSSDNISRSDELISTYQPLSSQQTSQHTTSDFPSAYISSYQELSSGKQATDFPSAYISSYGTESNKSGLGSASSTTSNDPIASRYTELIKIGSGGFGSVYSSYDTKAKRKKAVKVMGFDNFDALNFMMKEATQLMNIKHKNIIKVNEMFISPPKLLCIDMELYENGDLMKYTKPGAVCKEKIVKQICYQMLDALNYVHSELNCCHRDVKPSNVFISEENDEKITIVLADFGLAKSNQNSLASFSGTPLYMSPEIALGSSSYGNNVDIYSLGVSIYQIMTKDLMTSVNHLYFTKDESIVKSLLDEKMKSSNEYSNELISLVISMLEKDGSLRPQARDLLNNPYFDDQRE